MAKTNGLTRTRSTLVMAVAVGLTEVEFDGPPPCLLAARYACPILQQSSVHLSNPHNFSLPTSCLLRLCVKFLSLRVE